MKFSVWHNIILNLFGGGNGGRGDSGTLINAQNGTANTGGGGGGAGRSAVPGNGGSGVVYIWYPIAPVNTWVTDTLLDPVSSNEYFERTIEAIGGTLPNTYNITTSDLPSSVDLSEDGILSGTIDFVSGQPFQRNFNLTVEVEDALGYTNQKEFVLPVDQIYYTDFDQWRLKYLEDTVGVDPYDTANIETFGLSLGSWFSWNLTIGKDGKIYGVMGSGIIVIDPSGDTATYETFGLSLSSWSFNSAILGPDGKLYFIPYNAEVVLIIDTDPNSDDYFTAITKTFGLTLTDSGKWHSAILCPVTNKIFAIPSSSQDILVIDISNQTAIRNNLGATLPAGTFKYQGATLGKNGLIYCAPYIITTGILVINPATNTASNQLYGFTWSSGSFGSNSAFFLGSSIDYRSSGTIYFCPSDSRQVLRINTSNNIANSLTNYGEVPNLDQKYHSGKLGGDKYIYFLPRSTVDHFLRIDPVNQTAQKVNFGLTISGSYAASGCISLDGRMFISAPGENGIIILSSSTGNSNINSKVVLSPFINKY